MRCSQQYTSYFDEKNNPHADIDAADTALLFQHKDKHTWVFLVQKVTEIEEISLNYDEEGHSQKHKDDHVY